MPTCIHALKTLSATTDALEIHFADGEGDPYAVELAGRLGGFVVGNDSDFVVLNSEGYLGYIPLDEMTWSTSAHDDGPSEVEDNEFKTVQTKGKRKVLDPGLSRSLIPPEGTSDIILKFSVYTPDTVADHLKIPVTLLPLLGALLGNDFSHQPSSSHRNPQSLFFPGIPSLTQRINHVASTLKTILSASTLKRKPKHQVGSVMDLIDKAVEALLSRSRSTMGSGEVDAITNTIVDATLQYAIPKYTGDVQGQLSLWPTEVCALHQPDVCSLLSRSSVVDMMEDVKTEESIMREKVRIMYVRAYRAGSLAPKILDILSTGTAWPRIFLENPDLESVARSVGKPIRQWGYAILDDGIGLPDPQESSGMLGDEQYGGEDGEDELIDVVEEDSEEECMASGDEDPLEMLRGELERLRDPEQPEPPKSLRSSRISGSTPKTVTEYVRKGTRATGESVAVRPIIDILTPISELGFDIEDPTPLQLRLEDDRLTLFLHALGSNTPHMRSLPAQQLIVAAALRWVVRIFGDRAVSSGGVKDREKERWTKQEARAFLASFSWSPSADLPTSMTEELPAITDRNIQLMAQMLTALECIDEFAQILLLPERVPSRGHLLSGSLFHSFLTGVKTPNATDIPEGLWEACTDGLDDAFGEEWKKTKKANKDKAAPMTATGSPRNVVRSGGLFGLLSDMGV